MGCIRERLRTRGHPEDDSPDPFFRLSGDTAYAYEMSEKDIEVIQKYDSPDTLFYIDPPYPHESRGDIHAYAYEMSEKDHEKLAEALHSVKGKAAISGYRSPLTDRLYSHWTRIDAPEAIVHSVKKPRIESLWINYSLTELEPSALEKLKQMGVQFYARA
jgi:site-specific DNA-adenine methylase